MVRDSRASKPRRRGEPDFRAALRYSFAVRFAPSRADPRRRRAFLARALFFFAVAAAWMGMSNVMPPAVASDDEPAGSVKSVRAPAWVLRGEARIPAEKGMRLFPKDGLRTGSGAAMAIVMRDNTVVTMGTDTAMSLEEFVFEPRRGRFALVARMMRGAFSFLTGEIGKLSPESAEIQTPTGVIGVRGTRFLLHVEEAP